MFLIHENNLYKNQYVIFLILGVAYTQLIDLNIFYIFITPALRLPFNATMLAGQPQGIAPTRHQHRYIKEICT